MQSESFSSFNSIYLWVIDVYGKHACVFPLSDKKGITITNVFIKTLDESKSKRPKLNKKWVDKGGQFYNKSTKSWLQDNEVEEHLTHNEGKSVVAERFIAT